jgi:hypothetical protein
MTLYIFQTKVLEYTAFLVIWHFVQNVKTGAVSLYVSKETSHELKKWIRQYTISYVPVRTGRIVPCAFT